MQGSAGAVGRILAVLLGAPAERHESFVQPRARLPAHQLHPRRARGLGARPRLPARRVSAEQIARRQPTAASAGCSRSRSAARASSSARAPAAGEVVAPRVRRGMSMARSVYLGGARPHRAARLRRAAPAGQPPPVGAGRRGRPGPAGRGVTRRATLRGAERSPLTDTSADVLVCGASFAGLAVARELAGSGADVLLVDRYEIGERATSACAAPLPWLEAMGVTGAVRQEMPCMGFHTPARVGALPAAVELGGVRLRRAVPAAVRSSATRASRSPPCPAAAATRVADRPRRAERAAGGGRARVAAGARGRDRNQPPDAPLSRGLEVHPDGGGADLDVWIERSLVRYGYGWSVPAGGEQRVGVGSYEPRHHVREPTVELAARLERPPVRYQGNWFPHRLRPAAQDGVFFVGDSAGHCFPLSGEGIRTAFYFGIACGRELRARARRRALARRGAARATPPSARHTRAPTGWRCGLQWLIPRLPPRLLTPALRAFGRGRLVERAFGWYLDQAAPGYAAAPTGPRWRPRRARIAHAEPLAAVAAHVVDQRHERLALGGQRVLHPRRHLGVGVRARRCPAPRARAAAATACAG